MVRFNLLERIALKSIKKKLHKLKGDLEWRSGVEKLRLNEAEIQKHKDCCRFIDTLNEMEGRK